MPLTTYNPIKSIQIEEEISFHKPGVMLPPRLSFESPALEGMTDLKKVSAVTVSQNESIDRAVEKMKYQGVRLLLVTDISDYVHGLITFNDILGEKAVQSIQKLGIARDEIKVSHLMTHFREIEFFDITEVSKVRIGHILVSLKKHHRFHALVIDRQGRENAKTIRGIFSLTQIARQLGKDVKDYNVQSVLADIAESTK